jgi:threonylcarbamoyladenosine tRNA methylthiotransferase MtaB
MKTFSIQTLGCKVNQYESDQIAALLRARGMIQLDSPHADLRVVNTCSVTVQAASKSRQAVRRVTRLPVLEAPLSACGFAKASKTIVTGCWATSNRDDAAKLPGVDAVLTHHQDVAAQLNELLDRWSNQDIQDNQNKSLREPPPGQLRNDGWMTSAGTSADFLAPDSKPRAAESVKQKPVRTTIGRSATIGTRSLPLLGEHQTGRQRAFLKIQDGCDAHCSYCIIPQLRPTLWSKTADDAVEEARRLVDSGHKEIVLTGIFLGAFGHETALRRRQVHQSVNPIASLVEALCTKVPGLVRLRFSSLEPGDLSSDLVRALAFFDQVVPHFHLPLQSGSDAILHRMNRQYTRDDFLRMLDEVRESFDRPAITTDIIVGFPGETEAEFAQTLEVVEHVKFMHIHAFSFSPRPGTAAARWHEDFVHGPLVNQRIDLLKDRAASHSYEFRRQFIGQTVQVLVQRDSPSPRTRGEGWGEGSIASPRELTEATLKPLSRALSPAYRGDGTEVASIRHGRCERYFDVHFEDRAARAGDLVRLRIDRVTQARTIGTTIQ